jgi:hypothetical protein
VYVLLRRSRGLDRAAIEVGRVERVNYSYISVRDKGRLSRDCVYLVYRDAVEHNRFCAGKQA